MLREEEEIWKPVVGYEGRYDVSNLGRVKSLNYNRSGESRIMKPFVNKKGYECIRLSKDGSVSSYRVSRLVAASFIPNPKGKPYVDHIDTDRRNNRADNLRWCDQSENQRNPISRERYGKTKAKAIVQLTLDNRFVREWPSAYEAERNGFNRDLIRKVIAGKSATHKGFLWKYKTDYDQEQED